MHRTYAAFYRVNGLTEMKKCQTNPAYAVNRAADL